MVRSSGLAAECGTHRMRLLFVVRAQFDYRCDDCGGHASFGLDNETAGLSTEKAAAHNLELLTKVTGMTFEYVGVQKPCACQGVCPCHREE
jgi:hypothetical protein